MQLVEPILPVVVAIRVVENFGSRFQAPSSFVEPIDGFLMPPLLPNDTLFAIAFAGGPSLSWKIGSTCSSKCAFREYEFLSLLRALFIVQLSETISYTRVRELTNFSNTLVVYASQLSVSAISQHCIGVITVMAKWRSGHFAWQVREVALMILADVGYFGKQQLAALRDEAQKIASELQLRPYTEAWTNYQQMKDCHKRRQCDASLVARDHTWLYLDPPNVLRPCMFDLTAALETPRSPTDSSSDITTSR